MPAEMNFSMTFGGAPRSRQIYGWGGAVDQDAGDAGMLFRLSSPHNSSAASGTIQHAHAASESNHAA